MLERTSTSLYYAYQLSSLTLPLSGVDNPALVRAARSNSILRELRTPPRTPDSVARMARVCTKLGITTSTAEIESYVDALDQPAVDGLRRAAELDALTTARPATNASAMPDLIVEPQDVEQYRGTPLGQRLVGISVVPRLRETRVLAGFGRSQPGSFDVDKGYAQMWGRRRPGTFTEGATDDWFPGFEVFGEGILLVLDPVAVGDWTQRCAHAPRLLSASKAAPRKPERVRPLPWLLAHTIAHLLIRALAPESGYPLPAIRERIFATDERTGLLVYTAAGDVRGTLGGLVELGTPERLGPILDAALDSARWCATDPVCIEEDGHRQSAGTGSGACHHCLFLPETSCEAFNRGLDRAALIGHSTTSGLFPASA